LEGIKFMVKIKKTKELSEEFGIKKVNSISDLETEIMKIMWTIDKASVREVHELMLKKEMEKKDSGFIPYTTVMATMATLAEKGLLKQDRSNKTFIYSAAINSRSLSRNIIGSVAEKLLDKSSKELIYKFLSAVEDVPVEKINKLLDELKIKK
ncbi:MAG: BlaI/MecI/CopY family transcriptional regulator, partial [Actinobacteria bacterium]|nr:BlaI/MecI/CopY family transcriptional regulator [Actinomycetota bacterium]